MAAWRAQRNIEDLKAKLREQEAWDAAPGGDEQRVVETVPCGYVALGSGAVWAFLLSLAAPL